MHDNQTYSKEIYLNIGLGSQTNKEEQQLLQQQQK